MCVEILEIPLVLQEIINQPSIKRLLLLQYSHSETCYAALVYNKLFKAARTQATCISVRYLQNTVIIRAHSFRVPRPFRVTLGLYRGILGAEFVFPVEFDVFHSTNYFFTENDLKVALLQVC